MRDSSMFPRGGGLLCKAIEGTKEIEIRSFAAVSNGKARHAGTTFTQYMILVIFVHLAMYVEN